MVEMSLPQTNSYERTGRTPVFIEFTPEYAKQHGLNRDIDRRAERTPKSDTFSPSDKVDMQMYNSVVMASMSPKDALGWIAVTKAVVELLMYGYDEIVKRYGKRQADMAQGALMVAMADATNESAGENKLDVAA